MPEKNVAVWDVGAGVALLGLLFTGMWAEFDTLGPAAWALGFGLFAFAWALLRYAGSPHFDLPDFGNTRATTLFSALLLSPLLVSVARSWNDEFPFSGDHDHHLLAIASAARFWTKNWLALAGFLFATCWGVAKARRAWWPGVVLGAMIAACFNASVPVEYFARYPATLYTLTVPLHLAAEWLGAPSVWPIDRLANVLAPVVWLFLLRPWLFGRTTRRGWMVGAVFLLTQREVLYYVNSVYLEAWPLVFVALACEALFHADDRPWLAPLLAGVACTFKDAAILVFLVVGLGAVWRGRRSARALAAVIGGGTLGVLPFLMYYLERRKVGVWRTLEIASLDEAFTTERLANLNHRVLDQFDVWGLAALALVTLTSLTWALWRGGRNRGPAIAVSLGGLGQLALFFVDKISLAWPGYPRLNLMPLFTVLAPTQLLPAKLAAGLAAAIGLGQAPVLGRYLASLGRPSYTRSFTEDFATPVFVPLRAAVTGASLVPGQTVRWIRDNDFEHPFVIPMVYRDLVALYRFEAARYDAREDECRCAPGLALFVTTPTSRNLHASMPFAPYPAPLDRIGAACRAAIAATCRCTSVGEPAEAHLCTSF